MSPSILTLRNIETYYGATCNFTITPSDGYRVVDVQVDGVSLGARTSYSFNNIAADHSITAFFIQENLENDDLTAPAVNNCAPNPGSIQVPLNTVIVLHVADAGAGVEAPSITIRVNNNIVYAGDSPSYISEHGQCWRIGTKSDYHCRQRIS